ncbi:hypothetical protein ACWOAH_02645 [Vagococcus vulneris]|uniref:Uncharacterized protein n=1 Tax=Vagococcus vulneris TaxID=1977869 RepID=A0A430A0X4_9ENTE|nr:hypothetical protein [Vagococcus vulneris]RSU00048.1 hypothetical protein CBF37_01730 [Vagococcus vulneris]
MDDNIFFNQGNVVTSDTDIDTLYREVQIGKNINPNYQYFIIQNLQTKDYLLIQGEELGKYSNQKQFKLIEQF